MIGRNIFVDRYFWFRKNMNQAHCKLCEFLHADSGTRIIQDLGEGCKYTLKIIFKNLYLKGVWHELSNFRFFHKSFFPWPPSILLGNFKYFRKLQRYCQPCGYRRCQRHRGLSLFRIFINSMTGNNLSPVTGENFAPVSAIPAMKHKTSLPTPQSES
jgi:hypothetical protein